MADSVDRVFVHALNTVKKIPRTGSARPPPADRLRLYGLYKQAMEGDVDGVMDRPGGREDRQADDLVREQEKWDAWDAQKGVGKTEAKRRYIEALIDTMHKYASHTADARELVAELEFVWDQIKNNSPGSSSRSSPPRVAAIYPPPQQFGRSQGGKDGGMRVLSPMSQDDESEQRISQELEREADDEVEDEAQYINAEQERRRTKKWRASVEAAMVKMTAEMAALREQIATGREWKAQKRQTFGAWVGWLIFMALRHLVIDAFLLGIVLFWLRRRKDRRFEDLVRDALKLVREYARSYLPAR